MPSKSYVNQFERVKRYLVRFKQINDGKAHDHTSPHYEDDVYAFFQNCYHLKDWIKADPTCSNWGCVENLINTSPDLAICADLANALKHLSRIRKMRSTENPSFAGSHIQLNITDDIGGHDSFHIAIVYKISTSSGDIDAFELAERCVAIWEDFINSNVAKS